jgi:prepilin-type N-terminal cleavage/methylation domain-containing protein
MVKYEPVIFKKRDQKLLVFYKGVQNSGFSLIEVLASMLILSLIIYMASISCSFFLKTWGQNKILSTQTFYEYKVRHLFRNALESSMDYMVKTFDAKKKESYVPFFEGTSDNITFVTRSSVYESLKPAICKFSVEKNSSGTFLVRYMEKSLADCIIERYDKKIVFGKELILFDDISEVKISYFGFLHKKMDFILGRMDIVYAW